MGHNDPTNYPDECTTSKQKDEELSFRKAQPFKGSGSSVRTADKKGTEQIPPPYCRGLVVRKCRSYFLPREGMRCLGLSAFILLSYSVRTSSLALFQSRGPRLLGGFLGFFCVFWAIFVKKMRFLKERPDSLPLPFALKKFSFFTLSEQR